MRLSVLANLFSLLALSGCSSSTMMMNRPVQPDFNSQGIYLLNEPKVLGDFILSKKSSSIIKLIENLEKNLKPQVLPVSKVEVIRFDARLPLQSALLVIDDGITTWQVMIQFVPDIELNTITRAYIIYVRSLTPGNPNFIYDVSEELYGSFARALTM